MTDLERVEYIIRNDRIRSKDEGIVNYFMHMIGSEVRANEGWFNKERKPISARAFFSRVFKRKIEDIPGIDKKSVDLVEVLARDFLLGKVNSARPRNKPAKRQPRYEKTPDNVVPLISFNSFILKSIVESTPRERVNDTLDRIYRDVCSKLREIIFKYKEK